MATRITRIDDIDGSEGAEAINFELDHHTYEIDLGPRNRAKFLRMIRPFIERAREVEASEAAGRSSPRRRGLAENKPEEPADSLSLEMAETISSSGEPDLFEMARQMQP
jgi:hypothetical protein